jgi:cytochrome d ubiquinol oxidase subunit I
MSSTLGVLLAVNPVPWARAQMAFTLAVHIILVPLGVSWAAMTLIANYRGIKKGDATRCSWRNGGPSTWQ